MDSRELSLECRWLAMARPIETKAPDKPTKSSQKHPIKANQTKTK